MIPIRTAAIGGAQLLRLSNVTTLVQGTGAPTLDIPYLTRTGKILLLVVCGDSSSTVESPYTITFDLAGAAVAFTQRKTAGGGEASLRPRLIIATVTGAPVTGVSKLISIACFAGSLSNFNIVVADLPPLWSGTVGTVDGSAANGAVNTYTSPAISTGARNSLLVGCGGCLDATLGALAIAGAGGQWRLLVPQTQSGAGSTAYTALFGTKIVPVSGTSVSMNVSTVSGATSLNWSAGLIELRP